MDSIEVLFSFNNSQFYILSPAVGYYYKKLNNEAFLSEGSSIGKLKILNITYELHLPKGVYGKVKIEKDKDKIIPVEYGQELFRLIPDKNSFEEKKQTKISEYKKIKKAEGEHLITAFTNGIFYRKPSPELPPYARLNQEIEKGKVLGLIEVMKTFNQITFLGTGKNDSQIWKIKKIVIEDGEEVKSGQPLFLLEKK